MSMKFNFKKLWKQYRCKHSYILKRTEKYNKKKHEFEFQRYYDVFRCSYCDKKRSYYINEYDNRIFDCRTCGEYRKELYYEQNRCIHCESFEQQEILK